MRTNCLIKNFFIKNNIKKHLFLTAYISETLFLTTIIVCFVCILLIKNVNSRTLKETYLCYNNTLYISIQIKYCQSVVVVYHDILSYAVHFTYLIVFFSVLFWQLSTFHCHTALYSIRMSSEYLSWCVYLYFLK